MPKGEISTHRLKREQDLTQGVDIIFGLILMKEMLQKLLGLSNAIDVRTYLKLECLPK